MKASINYLLILLLAFAILSCSDDEGPTTLTAAQVEGTWGIDESSVRVQGLTLDALYDVAGIPAANRPDWSTFRIFFSNSGVYVIQNVNLIGLEAEGTWEVISGENKIRMNPGNVEVLVNNVTSTSMDIVYSINTTGTEFAALGGRATVAATLVK
jgi:hypothetical protein